MSFRVAIGEFKQETNTFAAVPTTLQSFRDFHLLYGDDSLSLRGTNTEMAGFLDIADEEGWQILPSLAAFAISAAPVTADAYLTLQADLLRRFKEEKPLDAVLLSLHGAMVAEGEDDPDGATIEAVRRLVGSTTPLIVTMDLHANLTERCVRNADAIVAFKTCPHIDLRDTGQRAGRLLARILKTGQRPFTRMAKLPMVTAASTHIHSEPGPFQRLMDASKAAETGDTWATCVFTVQPWLDIPEFGYATCATALSEAQALAAANRLADLAWNERHELMDTKLVPVGEAIRRAISNPRGPVVLSDLADGTGAGSPGDATAVIAALLQASPDSPAFVTVVDAAAAEEASRVGVGGGFDFDVGGKMDCVFNKPVRFKGTVELSRRASFSFGSGGYEGASMDMGLSAVVRSGNVYLLITSKPVFTIDPELYRSVGLEPSDAQIVVVKSHIHFRAAYGPIASELILLDSPGMSSDHLTTLPFKRIPRPMFPFDPETRWEPAG